MMKLKSDTLKDEVGRYEQVEEDPLVLGFKELFLKAQESSRQTEASFCAYSGGENHEAEFSAIGDLGALTDIILIYERVKHEGLGLVDVNDLVSMRRFMESVHSRFSRWISMGFYNPSEDSKPSELFAGEISAQELRRQISSDINHLMEVVKEVVDFRSYVWRLKCLPPLVFSSFSHLVEF